MSQRLSDYLAHEAGEYLERMSWLLSASAAPSRDEMLRLARGIRGSARMAGADDVGDVAERLENELRVAPGGATAWPGDSRERCLRLVAELEGLLYAGGGDLVPISDLFYDDAGPHVIEQPADAAPAEDLVSIDVLQYDGDAALRRALELRPALTASIDSADRTGSAELIDEIFDLIRLALPDNA